MTVMEDLLSQTVRRVVISNGREGQTKTKGNRAGPSRGTRNVSGSSSSSESNKWEPLPDWGQNEPNITYQFYRHGGTEHPTHFDQFQDYGRRENLYDRGPRPYANEYRKYHLQIEIPFYITLTPLKPIPLPRMEGIQPC